MASTLPASVADKPRKMLTMRGETARNSVALNDSSDRKPLAEPSEADRKRMIGRVIEGALEYARITKQQAAYAMGYEDQSALSRWIAGAETPQLAKLWHLGRDFQHGFLIGLAHACEADVEVRTVVTVNATRAEVA